MSLGLYDNKIGQFFYRTGDLATRTVGDKTFSILVSSAYDANGLIGSEINGIVVLNETDRRVVLDRHMIASSTFELGGYTAQKKEFKRVLSLDDAAFLNFLKSSENYRPGSAGEIINKPRDRRTLMTLAEQGVSYNAENKAAFATEGQRLLRNLAKMLKVPSNTSIRYNPGGIAVGGDHILHADHLYVHVSASGCYFRSCKDQQDYTGGPNHAFKLDDLYNDPGKLVRLMSEVMNSAESGPRM